MLQRSLCILALLLFGASQLWSQNGSTQFWSDIPEHQLSPSNGLQRFIIPAQYRTVQVNVSALRQQLRAAENHQIELSIPMPDGSTQRFWVWETPVMAPELQAKYPDIRCYTGKGIDDPRAILKCDLTSRGFHAMTLSHQKGQVFIDPYYHGNPDYSVVYFKKDYKRGKTDTFECLAGADEPAHGEVLETSHPHAQDAPEAAGDCQHRRYRLALACTGEYAAFHGGTKPLVLAAMNTSMNRVNGVYERDFAITMQIITNNDTLIFLDAATDPYTNSNGSSMLGQNQTTVTQRIGAANYDIGHVFSTGGGGVAGLGVVCSNSNKARGVTGAGSPIGDPFDIDYVAHEMGHQFGGNHCFNNSCGGNINTSTAMEPGSGSTIMAYAGICSPNVQNNSDDYFHAINIQEIAAYTTTGTGNFCPVKTVTGNTAPSVNDVPNFTIPRSTPFALTAVATDPDAADVLTYCWEQMDPQSATMPPVSTSTGGPLFRSYDPTTSPTRFFPRLPDLVSNTNSTWEELPSVARTMNFRVVVRDNHAAGGCTDEDNVSVTVAGGAGPFVVTEPNTNIIWFVGEPRMVTWDVANTTAAPVSCANVKITLSTDGGFTYPFVLAENVPNNGSATITVPNQIANTCRVRVEAIGNIFFDISNVNFRIQAPPTPTFVMTSSTNNLTVCAGQSGSFDLNLTGLVGFNTPAVLTVAGAPGLNTVAFAVNPVTPSGATAVTIDNLTPAMAGNYPIVITATAGAIVQTATVNLSVLPGAPSNAPLAVAPANGATGVATIATLSWNAVSFASNYTVELCPNPAFAPAGAITTLNSATTSVQTPVLPIASVMYWRIKAENNCGTTTFSNVYAFQTGGEACNQVFNSTNVPVNIDVNGVANVSSALTVADNFAITDVNVSVNINHSWMGDIAARITGPGGATANLFDRPGVPENGFGCSGDNIVVTFDDEATNTAATLESTCNGTPPAISGNFRALDPLSVFDGSAAQGVWTLFVDDGYPGEDEGAITGWSVVFCLIEQVGTTEVLANLPLSVQASAGGTVSNGLLNAAVSGAASQVIFTLLALPQSGVLSLNGVAITDIGATFTQADIDAGLLTYTHNGNNATADEFHFDVLDTNNGGWLHDQVFQINIIQNTLVATSAITAGINCNNEATGEITVSVSGGMAPLSYSLNGGAAQSSNVFAGLASGTYEVIVSDALGFTRSGGVLTLDNPPAILLNANVLFDDLTAVANGGTGVLEYSIDGVNYQPGGLFENLSDGIYTVTVRDANGCTSTTQAIVSVSTLLATAVISTPVNCFGGSEGAITVTAAGGFAPYTFSIDGTNFQTSNVFEGLASGSYSVTVLDANGSTTTVGPVAMVAPPALAGDAVVNLNTITVNVTGGTGALTYRLNGGPAQSSNIFGNLVNGVYTIIVTDANGCTLMLSASVEIPTLTIVNLTSENQDPCTGTVGLLTVAVSGGVPPYEYRIDGGAWQMSASFTNVTAGVSHTIEVRDAVGTTVSSSFTNTAPTPVTATAQVLGNDATVTGAGGSAPLSYSINGGPQLTEGDFPNLPNGNYTVVVSDVNGCTGSVSFSVNYLPVLLISEVVNVSCNGAADGSITVSTTGGIPPYTFNYSPSLPWTDLPPGNYSVTVTDGAGSSAILNATITEPNVLAATASIAGSTATINATGGTPAYVYSLDGGVFEDSPVFENLPNGNYTVVVADQNACTTTVEFLVNAPLSIAFDVSNVSCFGGSDGNIFVNVSGGTPPYAFTANPPLPWINIPAGSYSVTIIDALGSSATATTQVAQPSELIATASADGNGTVTAAGTGGTPPYQYSIDNGVTFQNNPVFTNVPSGTYTVVVKDANDCTDAVVVVGAQDIALQWGAQILPNPNNGQFLLRIGQSPSGNLLMETYDVTGKLIQSRVADTSGGVFQTWFDLSEKPQGMYFLRLSNGLQNAVLKVIVE